MSPLSGVDNPDRLRALLDAVIGISSDLSLPGVLRHIVDSAVAVVGARYGALAVLTEDGKGISDFFYTGLTPEQAAAIGALPTGRGVLGLVINDPRPLRLGDIAGHPDRHGFPTAHPRMQSFLGVPIRIRDHIFGNLYLTDKTTAAAFSDEDEHLAVALAGAAAIAVENARLHVRIRDLTLVEDRERIAADLHDTVIQRLFATGLALQGTVAALDDPLIAQRVEAAVDDLDETVRQIRSTIFALQPPPVRGRSLRMEVLSLVAEAAGTLGFEPHVRIDGPLDSALGDELARHLLAVLREALSNAARHARATRVEITVDVGPSEVRAEVADDGVGPAPGTPAGGRGLANLTNRAAALGGTMTLAARPRQPGTVLSWRAPLTAG